MDGRYPHSHKRNNQNSDVKRNRGIGDALPTLDIVPFHIISNIYKTICNIIYDMKRLLFILLVTIQMTGVYAQTKRFYCEVVGTEKEFSSGLRIAFDFGENPIYSEWFGLRNKQKLVDEQGEEIPFFSMVDAGNYLSDKGWTFQQAYSSSYGGRLIVHWIFFKDAKDASEAIEGIMTKEEFRKKNQTE